jgi:hypothetical protein
MNSAKVSAERSSPSVMLPAVAKLATRLQTNSTEAVPAMSAIVEVSQVSRRDKVLRSVCCLAFPLTRNCNVDAKDGPLGAATPPALRKPESSRRTMLRGSPARDKLQIRAGKLPGGGGNGDGERFCPAVPDSRSNAERV